MEIQYSRCSHSHILRLTLLPEAQACMCWHGFPLLDFAGKSLFFCFVLMGKPVHMWGLCKPISSLTRAAAKDPAVLGMLFCLPRLQHPTRAGFPLDSFRNILTTNFRPLSKVDISLGLGHNECPIHKTTNTVKRRERKKVCPTLKCF